MEHKVYTYKFVDVCGSGVGELIWCTYTETLPTHNSYYHIETLFDLVPCMTQMNHETCSSSMQCFCASFSSFCASFYALLQFDFFTTIHIYNYLPLRVAVFMVFLFIQHIRLQC